MSDLSPDVTAALQQVLRETFAPWVRELELPI